MFRCFPCFTDLRLGPEGGEESEREKGEGRLRVGVGVGVGWKDFFFLSFFFLKKKHLSRWRRKMMAG